MFSIFHSGNCERLLMSASWAEGVETIVTNDRYSKLSSTYFNINNDNIGWNNLRQRSKVSEMTEYTHVVADLIDNINQHNEFNNPKYPVDRVQDYTLQQIQASLNRSRGPHTWKNRLISQHYNPSEKYVEELFNSYMYNNCK